MNKMKDVKFVNGIKGLETMKVVCLHFIICFFPAIYYGVDNTWVKCVNQFPAENWIGKTPLFELVNGSFAVYFFFILSGFGLSFKFFNGVNQKSYWKKMLGRGVFFFITTLSSIFFSWCILALRLNYNISVSRINGNGALSGYLYPSKAGNIIEVIKDTVMVLLKGSSEYNVVTWFMHDALLGSVLVYIILWLCKKCKKTKLILCISVVLTILYPEELCFVVGIAISYLYSKKLSINIHREALRIISWIMIGGGILLGGYPIVNDVNRGFYSFLHINWKYCYLAGSVLILLGIFCNVQIQKIFEYKIFLWIGKYSYGIYLAHFPIIMSLGCWLFLKMSKINYVFAAVVSSLLTTAVIIVAGIALQETVIKYIGKLEKKIQ